MSDTGDTPQGVTPADTTTANFPSAGEFMTGASKNAHGSGEEDAPPKKISWRGVGTTLCLYLPLVSALALAAAIIGSGLMADGCQQIVDVLKRHGIKVGYLFRYLFHMLFGIISAIHIICFVTLLLSWAAIATQTVLCGTGCCLRSGFECFISLMAFPAWCTILAAVAVAIVSCIGWTILEFFDKAICPYQDELSQQIHTSSAGLRNPF